MISVRFQDYSWAWRCAYSAVVCDLLSRTVWLHWCTSYTDYHRGHSVLGTCGRSR